MKNTSSVNNKMLKQEKEIDQNDYTVFHLGILMSGGVFNDVVQVYEITVDNIKGSIYLYD